MRVCTCVSVVHKVPFVNRTLFASNKQLEEAKKLLNDYKQNPQMKVDAERLWGAKKGTMGDDGWWWIEMMRY